MQTARGQGGRAPRGEREGGKKGGKGKQEASEQRVRSMGMYYTVTYGV